MRTTEDNALLLLILALSVAFAWILAPFYGAVLWGVVFAILFTPLYTRLRVLVRGHHALAAIATVLLVLVVLILPLIALASSLTREVTTLYLRIQSGELAPGQFLQSLFDALPPWALQLLERFGDTDSDALKARANAALLRVSQLAGRHVFSAGQNMLSFAVSLFVMLYLLYFLLRDGQTLTSKITRAIPLRPERMQALVTQFAAVVRATVKSNVAVAVLQGAFGALIFFVLGIRSPLLWGALMAVLSLMPIVGAILVWLPTAIYLITTGHVWKGAILIAYGLLVIGLVDNVVRPLMVSKGASLPDYVVLISTLGGIATVGVNGFIVGPLIAAMFVATWDIFASEAR
jgi:predicted PurR-regulated permease PerM